MNPVSSALLRNIFNVCWSFARSATNDSRHIPYACGDGWTEGLRYAIYGCKVSYALHEASEQYISVEPFILTTTAALMSVHIR
jgi:hypothetical protein